MPLIDTDFVSYLESPLTWLMFVWGAMIGSFLNVCIIRIPEKTFFKTMRSACPHCEKIIPAYHNIPIISWLLLRGKSACCGQRISPQYLLIELSTAILFVLLYWNWPFVVTVNPRLVLEPAEFIRFAHATLFCCILLVCSVIDFHLQIIPDVISLPMVAISPLVFWVHPELTWKSSLIGVAAGGGSLYLIAWGYFMARGEAGLGMGDVKLLAGIGGWLGWESLIPTVLVGSVVGAITGLIMMAFDRKMNIKTALPFGPFLALGAVTHLFFGSLLAEQFFT